MNTAVADPEKARVWQGTRRAGNGRAGSGQGSDWQGQGKGSGRAGRFRSPIHFVSFQRS